MNITYDCITNLRQQKDTAPDRPPPRYLLLTLYISHLQSPISNPPSKLLIDSL